MNEAVDYVKTELMPDFDFDAFNHDDYVDGEGDNGGEHAMTSVPTPAPAATPAPAPVEAASVETPEAGDNGSGEEVDKW